MFEPPPDLSMIIVSWNVRKLLDWCFSPPDGGHDLNMQNALRRCLWKPEIYLKSLRG